MWFQAPSLEGTIHTVIYVKGTPGVGQCTAWAAVHGSPEDKSTVAFIDDLFCYPYTSRKNESFLWLAALKQKSLLWQMLHPANQRNPLIYVFCHLMNTYWAPPLFWVLISIRKLLIWWLRGTFSNHFPENFPESLSALKPMVQKPIVGL